MQGLRYAASKGIGVIVMEPLMGGKLARPPARIRELFEAFPKKWSPADWALRWVWNQPEVSLVLSGMSAREQVEANLKSAEAAPVGCMSPEELDLIEQVRRAYQSLIPIPCTQCGYCMPCPSGVNIPGNLDLYNELIVHNDPASARFTYERFIPVPARASACTQCRICEEQCPQKIAISDWMPRVHAALIAAD